MCAKVSTYEITGPYLAVLKRLIDLSPYHRFLELEFQFVDFWVHWNLMLSAIPWILSFQNILIFTVLAPISLGSTKQQLNMTGRFESDLNGLASWQSICGVSARDD